MIRGNRSNSVKRTACHERHRVNAFAMLENHLEQLVKDLNFRIAIVASTRLHCLTVCGFSKLSYLFHARMI